MGLLHRGLIEHLVESADVEPKRRSVGCHHRRRRSRLFLRWLRVHRATVLLPLFRAQKFVFVLLLEVEVLEVVVLVFEGLGVQLGRIEVELHFLELVLAILVLELALGQCLLQRGRAHAAKHVFLVERVDLEVPRDLCVRGVPAVQMQPNTGIQRFEIIVLREILPQAANGREVRIDARSTDSALEIALLQQPFILNPRRLLIQLRALKAPIRRSREVVLQLLLAYLLLLSQGIVALLLLVEIEVLQQNVILIEVRVVAPFGPPFGVDDVALELVEGALDQECLLDFVTLPFEEGHFSLLDLIDLDPQALQYNLSLFFWADSLAVATAELLLSLLFCQSSLLLGGHFGWSVLLGAADFVRSAANRSHRDLFEVLFVVGRARWLGLRRLRRWDRLIPGKYVNVALHISCLIIINRIFLWIVKVCRKALTLAPLLRHQRVQVVLERVRMLRAAVCRLQACYQRVLMHVHVQVERVGRVRLLTATVRVVLRLHARHQSHGGAGRLPQILRHLILCILSRQVICIQ